MKKNNMREVAPGIWEKKTLIAPGVYLQDCPGYRDLREWDRDGEPIRAEPNMTSDTCFCGAIQKAGGKWERCRCSDDWELGPDEELHHKEC
jgi:hypothetical protein